VDNDIDGDRIRDEDTGRNGDRDGDIDGDRDQVLKESCLQSRMP
jgi:hypothetical protein